ncbi:MAG: M20/M25/M40 family metallo-hydrolase [Pseudomonadota bacterium]
MTDTLRTDLMDLIQVPGLSGHEDRVRRALSARLPGRPESDTLGNLWVTFDGDPKLPTVMLFTHMDQLGFVVRKIETSGLIRLERLGGVPERALAAQAVLICVGEGRDVMGVIGTKSHHATGPEEKYRVVPYQELNVDAGFTSATEAEAAGVRIGTPVVYAPRVLPLAGTRIAGTAIDDRAGCAVLLDVARSLAARLSGPTVHLCFTVQEEFNLRGAQPLAQRLSPDIAVQVDLMLATDTPDMADRGEMVVGGGPGLSLYSFHGRGTLNGVIPHPAVTALIESTAARAGVSLQRSAQTGVLTDLSYVQLTGQGVACADVGFPIRYSHSALEVCDLADLLALAELLKTMLAGIDGNFTLDRDAVT